MIKLLRQRESGDQMWNYKKAAIVLFVFLASNQSSATFDLRLGLSTNNGNPTNANAFLNDICSACGINSQAITGTGVDAILKLPGIPIGFGIRYEQLGATINKPGIVNVKSTYTRTALLLNYRILSNFVYLGPIVSYGISDSSKFKYEDSVNNLSYDLNSASNSSYTAGIEAGLNLGAIIFGAEAGVGSIKAKGFKTSTDQKLTSPNGIDFDTLDYTGPYAKVHLGIGF